MRTSRVAAAVRGLAGRTHSHTNRGVVYKYPGVVTVESLPYPKLEVRSAGPRAPQACAHARGARGRTLRATRRSPRPAQ